MSPLKNDLTSLYNQTNITPAFQQKLEILQKSEKNIPSHVIRGTLLNYSYPLLLQFFRLLTFSNHHSKSRLNRAAIFNTIIKNIFRQLPLLQPKGNILINGYVLGDGKGDYYHMLSFAKTIRKIYQDTPITILALSDAKHMGSLPVCSISSCVTHIFFDDYTKNENIKKLLEAEIKKAALIISGPVSLSRGLWEFKKRTLSGLAINEYDFKSNKDDDFFKFESVDMGLSKFNAGIFISSHKKLTGSWLDVTNKPFKELLFRNCTTEDVDAYQKTNAFFVCYIHNIETLLNFIDCAISFSNYENKECIDIWVPFPISAEMLKNEIVNQGIGELHIICYKNEQKIEENINLNQNGKKVRLIYVGFLSKEDFYLIMKLSGAIVGCTGDGSLSDVLSFGKIPFYDIVPHKTALRQNLINITKKKIGENSSLFMFLTGSAFNLPGTEEKLLNWPQLIEEAKILGKLIRKEYSFKPYLLGAINEQFYRQRCHSLSTELDYIKKEYIYGNSSLKQMQIKVLNAVIFRQNYCKL